MPKVSKTSATKVTDIGIGQIHEDTVDGYEMAFLDLREEVDMGGLLKGLPDDLCPCPHWGYVTRDGSRSRSATTRGVQAGDAFHVVGGHSPAVVRGYESYLLFSPADEMAVVNETIQRNLAAMQARLTDIRLSPAGTGRLLLGEEPVLRRERPAAAGWRRRSWCRCARRGWPPSWVRSPGARRCPCSCSPRASSRRTSISRAVSPAGPSRAARPGGRRRRAPPRRRRASSRPARTSPRSRRRPPRRTAAPGAGGARASPGRRPPRPAPVRRGRSRPDRPRG